MEKARKACMTYGLPVEGVHPARVLQSEIERTEGHVLWLGDMLASLGEEQLVQRISTETKAGDQKYWLKRVEAGVAVWLELYIAERKHLESVTRTALAVGLEEKRLALAAREVSALEAAMLAILGDLGIDVGEPQVRRVVAIRLTEAAQAGNDPGEAQVIPMRR